MEPFRHLNAETLEDAIQTLVDHEGRARFMAGGTDLLGLLKTKALPTYPELLINIKRIPGLDRIEKSEAGLRIGALARLADIVDSPEINDEVPILARAAESVAMEQIRRMGTLGGNLAQETRCWYYRYPHAIGGRILCARKGDGKCLAVTGDNRYHAIFGAKRCFAVCPSDTAVALAALDAGIRILGPEGERTLPVADLYTPMGNVLGPAEIITEIRIPRPEKQTRQVFLKHRVRDAIDFAIVSVAAAGVVRKGVCDSARIVLGAVAPGPYRAARAEETLEGSGLDEETIEAVAVAAVEGARPLSRNAYKIEIARALVKRALLAWRTDEV